MAEPVTDWQRSTRCGGGDCVEVAEQPGAVLVRDSKDPDGSRLTFTAGSWAAFLDALKAGEL